MVYLGTMIGKNKRGEVWQIRWSLRRCFSLTSLRRCWANFERQRLNWLRSHTERLGSSLCWHSNQNTKTNIKTKTNANTKTNIKTKTNANAKTKTNAKTNTMTIPVTKTSWIGFDHRERDKCWQCNHSTVGTSHLSMPQWTIWFYSIHSAS